MAQNHYLNTESTTYVPALEKKKKKKLTKCFQRAERSIAVGKPVLLLDNFFLFNKKKAPHAYFKWGVWAVFCKYV